MKLSTVGVGLCIILNIVSILKINYLVLYARSYQQFFCRFIDMNRILLPIAGRSSSASEAEAVIDTGDGDVYNYEQS